MVFQIAKFLGPTWGPMLSGMTSQEDDGVTTENYCNMSSLFHRLPGDDPATQSTKVWGRRYWSSLSGIHNNEVIMSTMASLITSPTIVYSSIYSGTGERKHQSSASLAFVWRIHRWPVNSPHKGPVTREMFRFDDVIMNSTSVAVGLLCIVNDYTFLGWSKIISWTVIINNQFDMNICISHFFQISNIF